MGKLIKLKVNEVYQLKITLQETKPEIWRRFLVVWSNAINRFLLFCACLQ